MLLLLKSPQIVLLLTGTSFETHVVQSYFALAASPSLALHHHLQWHKSQNTIAVFQLTCSQMVMVVIRCWHLHFLAHCPKWWSVSTSSRFLPFDPRRQDCAAVPSGQTPAACLRGALPCCVWRPGTGSPRSRAWSGGGSTERHAHLASLRPLRSSGTAHLTGI